MLINLIWFAMLSINIDPDPKTARWSAQEDDVPEIGAFV